MNVFIPKNKSNIARRAAWVSLVANFLLFIFKLYAGNVAQSIALKADAWHTLSDSFSSLILIYAFFVASRPADREHPFGHGRAELIASLVLGVLLAFIGFNFLLEAYQKFTSQTQTHYGAVAIAVTIASILVKEAMAQYSFWAGKKSQSSALRADAWHHRSDALSSVVILIGIFLGKFFWWIDSVLTVAVSLLIFLTTYEILKTTASSLLGERPPSELIKKIKEIADSTAQDDVLLHDIQLHDYRNRKELIFHIRLPANWSLKKAHDLATAIENAIAQELNISTNIHIDPLTYDTGLMQFDYGKGQTQKKP